MIERGSDALASNDGWLTLDMRVNGRDERVRARSHHTLLDVLRERVGRVDIREGCGIGMCGACTVIVDGRMVSGCLVLAAQAHGSEVVTVEGLTGPSGELHPVQDAFIEHTGFQCSYCTPGFVLATKTLLDEEPGIDLDGARSYLGGNLCRCGSYVKILDAVMDARDRIADGGGSSQSHAERHGHSNPSS
jgi:carbon-monoxide dehydrogenase small subunit/isoquinoline 1-oxidoreductase alpha subunit/xanthine dehydrogenase YagT iron-sulfur-binding subunit